MATSSTTCLRGGAAALLSLVLLVPTGGTALAGTAASPAPVAPTASPEAAASPAASPIASPVASPAASPLASPTASPTASGAPATAAPAPLGPPTGLRRTASLTRTAAVTTTATTTSAPAPVTTRSRTVRRFGTIVPVKPVPAPVAAPAPATGSSVVLPVRAGGRGPQASYVPVGDVVVPVGGLTQALLDASPDGTRFVLAAGVHRLTRPLVPGRGQQLLGQYGAVLSGAKELTGWVPSGGAWYVDGQTQRLPVKDTGGHDVCVGGALCQAAEDVFVDDRPLRQVATRAALAPGSFFFDYAANRIWVAEDPTGRRVETTVTHKAVDSGSHVVLRNLVVEKFGNTYQSGAISGEELVVTHCLVRLNHGGGIFNYGGAIVHSVIERNGQIGLGGGGTNQVVEDNEIAHNNWAGFDPGWEAGGTKFAMTDGIVVRNNWVHHNEGNGLWTDIDNIRTTYEGNLVEDNTGIGIFHEISYEAVIRGNTVRRNGSRDTTFNGRVGINVTNSRGVQVLDNVVEDNVGGPVLAVQDTRGSAGAHGPRELRGLRVAGNTMKGGGYRGVWVYDAVPNRAEYFTSRGLVFEGNRYRLASTTARSFLGGDARLGLDWEKTWPMWLATGQDRGSSLY